MEAGLLGVLFMLIVVAGVAVWVYALIDVIRTPDGRYRAGTQLIWVLVILFGNLIGAVIYLAVGRPQRV